MTKRIGCMIDEARIHEIRAAFPGAVEITSTTPTYTSEADAWATADALNLDGVVDFDGAVVTLDVQPATWKVTQIR